MADNDPQTTNPNPEGGDPNATPPAAPAPEASPPPSPDPRVEALARMAQEERNKTQLLADKLAEERIASLPENERTIARERYEVAKQKMLVDQAKQAAEGEAKLIVANQLASKYGVEVSEIENLPTPESMEQVASALGKAKGVKPNTDGKTGPEGNPSPTNLPPGGGPTPSAATYDDSKFKGTGDVEGSLRAQVEAGLLDI